MTTQAVTTEESGAHHAPRFGFSLGDEEARIPGFPAEPLPLSPRGVRNWTIGSLVGAALFASVAAVALSRDESPSAKNEPAPLPQGAVPAQAAAGAPAAPGTVAPRVIPLEALPIANERKTVARIPRRQATPQAKPAHVTLAKDRRTATSAKTWSSRALVPNGTRAKTTPTTATATKKSSL